MGLAIRLTPLVRALVVANGAVFLLQLLADRFFPFTQWFGLVPALVARGAVWQLGTYMFLHGGLLHLLFNLWALAVFGADVEQRLGTAAFARFYAFCGVGAGACALLLAWGSASVVVGASGAIFGVLLAFALFYPRRPVTLLLFFVLPLTLEARVLVAVLGALNVLMLAQAGGKGLGQLAHLGGLLFAWLWLRGPDFVAGFRTASRRRRAERRLKVYDAVSDERRSLQAEVDGLLDKISRGGMGGLSDREKRRLVEASERLKRL